MIQNKAEACYLLTINNLSMNHLLFSQLYGTLQKISRRYFHQKHSNYIKQPQGERMKTEDNFQDACQDPVCLLCPWTGLAPLIKATDFLGK